MKVEYTRAGANEIRIYDGTRQKKPHVAKRNDADDTPGSVLEPESAHHAAQKQMCSHLSCTFLKPDFHSCLAAGD